jgi:glycosyltransferase involved in cell wall biosynthesis
MSKGEIAWFTPPVGVGVGYGYAAVETIRGIQNHGVRVSYATEEPRAIISFVQPDYYRGTNDQYRIGYTPWESTEMPEHWMLPMREMDEIWTTSTFCKEIYEQYNVNNIIHIVPHGIDPEIWNIVDRAVADKFYFFHLGGSTARKGGQKVVDAFLDLYDGKPEYQLVLKSNGPTETRYYDGDHYMGSTVHHPQIQCIESDLQADHLADLYNRMHCLVYPTNGEGFGLIPFQGIASGLPTICTNATACADYADLSVPLDYKWTDGQGLHLGKWAKPDEDDLRDKMKYVVDNYNEVKNKTLQSARIIHDTQTWGHVAEGILRILGDKVYERV